MSRPSYLSIMKKDILQPISNRTSLSIIEQLARLLKSGIGIVQALTEIERSVSNKRLKEALKRMILSIQNGLDIADSARRSGVIFAESDLSLLSAGEKTGKLPEVMGRIAIQRRRAINLKRDIMIGSVYPIMILVFSAFLLPLGQLIGLGFRPYIFSVIKNLTWLIIIAFGIFIVPSLLRLSKKTLIIKKMLWFLPIFNIPYRKKILSECLWALSTGIQSGLNIYQSLDIAGSVSNHPIMNMAFRQVSKGISNGMTLAEALAQTHCVPNHLLVAIAGGEKAGTLTDSLDLIVSDLEKDVTEDLKVATTITNIMITFLATMFVAMQIFSSAQGILPGKGGTFDDLEKEIFKHSPFKPIPSK